nr:MAG TPA: hypothetical protein [Caudoviricetes sp.]
MFLHHFTEVYDIFAPFLPLLKQKTLVSASVFFESGRYSIIYLYYTIFSVRANKKPLANASGQV